MLARRPLMLLLALAVTLVVSSSALAGEKPGKGAKAEPPTDQLVVRLAPGASLDLSALDATAGIDLKRVRQLADGSYVLKLGKRHDLEAVQAITDKLAARGDVVSAEPDAMMQWDPLESTCRHASLSIL